MDDKKISELITKATINDNDFIPIVDNEAAPIETKKVLFATIYDLFAPAAHNHAGIYEPVIAAGVATQYWAGNKAWTTLNQAAVAGLTIDSSPIFAGGGITNTNGITYAFASALNKPISIAKNQYWRTVDDYRTLNASGEAQELFRINLSAAGNYVEGSIECNLTWEKYNGAHGSQQKIHIHFASHVGTKHLDWGYSGMYSAAVIVGITNLGSNVYAVWATASSSQGLFRVHTTYMDYLTDTWVSFANLGNTSLSGTPVLATYSTFISGKVGIGVVTPVSLLTLLGGSNITPSADSTTALGIASFAAPTTQWIVFDTTNKRMGVGSATAPGYPFTVENFPVMVWHGEGSTLPNSPKVGWVYRKPAGGNGRAYVCFQDGDWELLDDVSVP